MPVIDWNELPAHQREMLKLYGSPISNTTASSAEGKTARLKLTEEMRNLYVDEGLTYTEIGERFGGISRQAVEQKLKPLLTISLKQKNKELREEREEAQRQRQRAEMDGQFRKLLLKGAQKGTIRKQLGLTWSQLDQMLSELDQVTRLRWTQRLSQGHGAYEHAYIVACLQEAFRLNGGSLGIRSYLRLRKSHPHWVSMAPIINQGGWNYWMKQAGLPVHARPIGLGIATISDDECRKAVARISLLLGGRLPSLAEYTTMSFPSEPSGGTIRKRGKQCQSWVAGLEYLLPTRFEKEAA